MNSPKAVDHAVGLRKLRKTSMRAVSGYGVQRAHVTLLPTTLPPINIHWFSFEARKKVQPEKLKGSETPCSLYRAHFHTFKCSLAILQQRLFYAYLLCNPVSGLHMWISQGPIRHVRVRWRRQRRCVSWIGVRLTVRLAT